MKTDSSMHAAVQSLHQFYAQAQVAQAGVGGVRAEAQRLNFPDPELAARVASFLWRGKRTVGQPFTAEDVSEAFLAALLDDDSPVAQAKNPWVHWRSVLRDAGRTLGVGLQEVWEVVTSCGFGYAPSLVGLAAELGELFANAADRNMALAEEEKAGRIDAWKAALGAAWLTKGGEAEISAAGLAEVLLDHELRAQLDAVPGPWDVLETQARSFAAHAGVADALALLADASAG